MEAKRVQTKEEGKKVTDYQPALEEVLAGNFDAGIVQEKHFKAHPRREELVELATKKSSPIFWLTSSSLDEVHAEALQQALINFRPADKTFPDKVAGYSKVTEEETALLMEAGDAVYGTGGDSK